ncbi:ribosome maturation factor RimP [Nesterenkonia sp. NBAIMH1]|uniref:ribosome maturation factor RimP n=1 Tax=Nesterenkonia sp. NBAIMH1 TaxID=2600320 RepID=UPI00143E085B|nr:ribosome maturation factor RimP [Nesterenkonia sp. NBAIMH1]
MAVPPRAGDDRRFPDERAERLAGLIEPTVEAHGLYLEELRLKPGATGHLQVVVDYFSGTDSVDLDTLASLSQAMEVVLDEHAESGPLAEVAAYELEVSTPGASRPLTEPRHFRRNLGRKIEVEREGESPMVGRLKDVDDESITVQEIIEPPKKGMTPKQGPETRVPMSSVARARVQVEFSHQE